MKLLNIKEENGITTYVFQGAFKFVFGELLDLMNVLKSSFFDKNPRGCCYSFNENRECTLIPDGELYGQSESFGFRAVGTKHSSFNSVPVTVDCITNTRRIEVSMETRKANTILDENGEILSKEALTDAVLDFISKAEVLGQCLNEKNKTVNIIRRQIEEYVKDPSKKRIEVGAAYFNIDEVLHSQQTQKPNDEYVS